MRLIAVSVCCGLSVLVFACLSVGTFTNGWWGTKKGESEKNYQAGLWYQCMPKCITYKELFDDRGINSPAVSKETRDKFEDWKDESKKKLYSIRACALISLVTSLFTLILISALVYLILRRTSVQIAWWLKLITAMCSIVTTLCSLVACILATDVDSIYHHVMKLKGSWLCMIIACVTSFIVELCLLVTFYLKSKQQAAESNPSTTQLSTLNPVRGDRSPPYVIPTNHTPYHIYPYAQYYADEKDPQSVDGYLTPTEENANYISNLSDFSSDQYAELSLDIGAADANKSLSYTNLTHSYEQIPTPRS